MMTVDYLKEKFEVKEDRELAAVLGKTPGAVSNWKRTGIPAIIERKATELLIERGLIKEPLTGYAVTATHRGLTPDQEQILQALEGKPIAQQFIKDVMQLDEPDMLNAYSDFVRNWKGKN